MLVRLLGLGLVAGAITASPAMAQSDRDDRARLHFESGRSYFEEGAYERALQEFETAYELSPRTAMLFNLGTTYERLGRLSEAADAFERYLEGSSDVPNRQTLSRRIANLRRRAESEETRESGEDGPDQNEATSDTSEASGGGEGLLLGGIVALAVGGAGLVATAILGSLALSEQSAVEDGCFATGGCVEDDLGSLRGLTLGTDIAWIGSAVVGAVGVVLLVLGLAGSDDDAQASIRWNGLGLEGSF